MPAGFHTGERDADTEPADSLLLPGIFTSKLPPSKENLT